MSTTTHLVPGTYIARLLSRMWPRSRVERQPQPPKWDCRDGREWIACVTLPGQQTQWVRRASQDEALRDRDAIVREWKARR